MRSLRRESAVPRLLSGQVVVSATGRSLIQSSPNEYNVSECDLETSTIRRSRPTRAVDP